MLVRTLDDRTERTLERLEHDCAGVADLERERRVDDIRRGQPVVEPAALLAEIRRDAVDEGGQVVPGELLPLGNGLRAWRL